MGDNTKIEWSDATWNPVTGCSHAGTPACDNCYAYTMANRLQAMGQKNYRRGFKVTEHPDTLNKPLHWRKPRKVFVVSMGDLFHKDVSNEFISAVFSVMAACPQHTFQVLTKRPKRMKEWFDWIAKDMPGRFGQPAIDHGIGIYEEIRLAIAGKRWPLPNVWIGTTVENMTAADSRIPYLLEVPAVVRFISVEPMLGFVDILEKEIGLSYNRLVERSGWRWKYGRIDWVICGGESGPKARSMKIEWVRSLREQCQVSGTPFLFKQWGEWNANGQRFGKKKSGRELDYKVHDEYPTV